MARSPKRVAFFSFLAGAVAGIATAVFVLVVLTLTFPAGAADQYAAELDRLLAGVVGMQEHEAVRVVCSRMAVEACKRLNADPNPEAHTADEYAGNRCYRIWYDRSQLVLEVDAKGTVSRTSVDTR